MKRVRLGIEKLRDDLPSLVAGRRVGLVANAASVDSELTHSSSNLVRAGAKIIRFFGPEHGFGGESQDMEPVEGMSVGPQKIPVHSLYGGNATSLSLPIDKLSDLDVLIVDLPDVGSRYYTFVWTALMCLRSCDRAGIGMILTDRPNPIGGEQVEGAPQKLDFLSFVGLFPVPNRHGMTVGEIISMAAAKEGLTDALEVVTMDGWERWMYHDDTGLPWVLPSPNMPTLDTAIVYPGMCLLEATEVSEGRGTTRPFEIFGVPGVPGAELAKILENMKLPGVLFRPLSFKPAFHKHAQEICGGVQIHVTDRRVFHSYKTGIAALIALKRILCESFHWRQKQYEFESVLSAIDMLSGDSTVGEMISTAAHPNDVEKKWVEEQNLFVKLKKDFILY